MQNNLKNNKNILKKFIQLNLYYNNSFKKTNSFYNFILGFKNQKLILDLKKIHLILKKVSFFLIKCFSSGFRVVVIGEQNTLLEQFIINKDFKEIVYIPEIIWKSGLFSNFDIFYPFYSNKIDEKRNEKNIYLKNLFVCPKIVIILNANKYKKIIKEAYQNKMIVVAFIDSTTPKFILDRITYAIPMNLISFESQLFFIQFLLKNIKIGRKLRFINYYMYLNKQCNRSFLNRYFGRRQMKFLISKIIWKKPRKFRRLISSNFIDFYKNYYYLFYFKRLKFLNFKTEFDFKQFKKVYFYSLDPIKQKEATTLPVIFRDFRIKEEDQLNQVRDLIRINLLKSALLDKFSLYYKKRGGRTSNYYHRRYQELQTESVDFLMPRFKGKSFQTKTNRFKNNRGYNSRRKFGGYYKNKNDRNFKNKFWSKKKL